MLFFEPKGSQKPEGAPQTSVRKFGEEIYAKVYRFVVVKAKTKNHYSKCLYLFQALFL